MALAAAIGCGGKSDSATGNGSSKDDSTKTGSSADEAKAKPPAIPLVEIDTTLGKIVVRLNPQKAGITVNNFLQYVNDGFYDQTIFHEVNRGYAVLGGGYTQDMSLKKARPSIRNEAHNRLKNVRGTIAMVRQPDVIDSATSQFMFNLADNPQLDYKNAETAEGYGYCVFGEVVEGMDVLTKIGEQKVHDVTVPNGAPFYAVPVEPIIIRSIKQIQ